MFGIVCYLSLAVFSSIIISPDLFQTSASTMLEQNNNISSPEATSDDLTRKSTLTRPDPSAIPAVQADPDSANRITPHQVSHAPVTLLIGNLTLSPRPLFDNKRKRIPSSPSNGHCLVSLTTHPNKKCLSTYHYVYHLNQLHNLCCCRFHGYRSRPSRSMPGPHHVHSGYESLLTCHRR